MSEESLEQRQLVWHHFKNGAPGIATDGPYVLDKRDVWYMRNVNEQDAGYKLESDYATISRMTNEGNRHLYDGTQNQFVPCDMCYQCLCIYSFDYITDCPVCASKVCGDCSCGCEEPADWQDTAKRVYSGARRAINSGAAVEFKYGGKLANYKAQMHHGFDPLPSVEELNIIRDALFKPQERKTEPEVKARKKYYLSGVDVGMATGYSLGIKCLRCNYFQVIPLPLPKRVNYYRCANCGNGIEIEDLF